MAVNVLELEGLVNGVEEEEWLETPDAQRTAQATSAAEHGWSYKRKPLKLPPARCGLGQRSRFLCSGWAVEVV